MSDAGRFKPFTRFKFQNKHPDTPVDVTVKTVKKDDQVETFSFTDIPHDPEPPQEFRIDKAQVVAVIVELSGPSAHEAHLRVEDDELEVIREVDAEYRPADAGGYELWCEIVYDYDHRGKSRVVPE